MTPPAAALVVHLFVDAGRPDPRAEHDHLRQVWQRLQARPGPGMTASLAHLGTEPDLDAPAGLLAGLRRPGAVAPYVEEALLRRVHDTFCLSVYREPAGATWEDLESAWAAVTHGLDAPSGLIGTAHLFLARLPPAGVLQRVTRRTRPDPAALDATVRRWLPDPPARTVRWSPGVLVPPGFAVWEASAGGDERESRRIAVVAPHDADERLSGWTWFVGPDRDLPELGRYLLHAAKLRYQLRVWTAEHPEFRQQRTTADATVDDLLALLTAARPRLTSPRLLVAARQVAVLQAADGGLISTHTALVEMRRTADIATANLTAASAPDAGGLFADDRALGAWFGQQLDDDAVYVGAARDRVEKVAALADQLLTRRAQDEHERFNLALTGAIGAILMVLAASQAFAYKPPLAPLVQPAVVALLGALALLSTLLMLWVLARGSWWVRVPLWLGWGTVGATTAWVATSALLGEAATETVARRWSLVGFAAVAGLAALWSAARATRTSPGGRRGVDGAPTAVPR